MVYLRKILVTTDLSDYSLAAVEYAASFGLLYSSTLHLLHVVDSKEGHRLHSDAEAHRMLEEFVAANVSPDVRFIPVVRMGHPAEEVCRFAEEEGVDLVIVATHGRTGLRHILLGSVAEKIVRLSSAPVLTVKPHSLRESIIRSEDVEKDLHLR
jgi:nucleotide-binding universal stress UspA family protein